MMGVAIPWLSVYKAPTCPAIEWDVDMRAVPVTERKGKRAGGKSPGVQIPKISAQGDVLSPES